MPDTIIHCGSQVKRAWPRVAAQWRALYPQLFDAHDVRLTQTQPKNHFAEWFAAIHIFHRDGLLSLIEKYIYETHPSKRRRVEDLGGRVLETLTRIRHDMHVQPPDLLVYSAGLELKGFAEVKGPDDRPDPSPRQRKSHREIERCLGVPVEIIKVRLTTG